MSIKLNQIYCNHFLKNEKLQEFCKNPQFESFSYPCHKVLTSFHIKDSIHYNTLISNNYKNYEEYIYTTNQQEHSVEKFLKLERDFDINKMKKIKVLYNFEKNKYFIQDGVHRLSILLYKKLINDAVPIKYLDIQQNNCFYFIIYEHAIEHCNAICNEIEKSKLRIDEKIHLELPSNNFTDFIFKIYPDNNKGHILEKNKYIINSSKKKEIVRTVILLISIDKWEHMGDKCKEIELVKRKIRNLYNPKFEDENKQIHPLNKGVSHNHVIHSIDFPKEFFPIYNVIDMYSKYIKSFQPKIVELDTNFIQYELRRNPIKIFVMNDIYYHNNKFNYKFNDDKIQLTNNTYKNIQYKKIEEVSIIFNLRWENNYGHFILDILIPIFKIICTYQNTLYPTNNLILYLNKNSYMPLNNKMESLLKCFVSDIRYLNHSVFFKKGIISYQSFKQPWKSKINDSVNKIKFLNSFRDIVFKNFNLNNNNNPHEINFVSRKNTRWRKVLNEDDIKYNKIFFENISLKEELEIINNTKILIAPYGAGIVSGFFLKKNSTIIIIYPPNFSYTRDCSTMEIDILNKLGINVICSTHECEIIKPVIYENNITSNNNLVYNRDKNFNIENLEKLINILDGNIDISYNLTIAQLLTDNKHKSINYNFRQLKEKQLGFFKNKDHEMNVRIENLKDVINIFSKCNIQYWLQGKTLLGMVKDNKLIENDHDEDIGTMCENIETVCNEIIPKLKNMGFEVIRATSNNSMVSLMRNLRYIDICFFINKNNEIGYEKKFFPKNYYDSFIELNINGFIYNIPLKFKDIIKFSYNIQL